MELVSIGIDVIIFSVNKWIFRRLILLQFSNTDVTNINKATEGKDEVPILDLMADALEATPVRNSGGGHYNHGTYHTILFICPCSQLTISILTNIHYSILLG